jgi:predicted dehydrogenase/nucleoside-diphosphate-sugar epimerase
VGVHKNRVAFVGTGNIAGIHGEVFSRLREPKLVGVVDPREDRAAAFAKHYGSPGAYADLERLITEQNIGTAHVLTPPDTHAGLILNLVARGVDVLVEKPMATSRSECDAILRALAQPGAGALYVSHNFIFHPAFRRLSETVRAQTHGDAVAMTCTYAMPLRQLEAGQLSHWMFRRPVNLLLEQAVHPLSQIVEIAGPIEAVRVLAGRPRVISSECMIPSTVSVLLRCQKFDVQLYLEFGANFPRWHFGVQCTDGFIEADILANRVLAQSHTQWLAPIDNLLEGRHLARDLRTQDGTNLSRFVKSLLKLDGPSDPFYLSMLSSVGAFYARDAATWPAANRAEGASGLVRVCEDIAAASFEPRQVPTRAPRASVQPETIVIGGSGFIGRQIVKALVAEGRPVGVLARNSAGLPDLFRDPLVTLIAGSMTRSDDLAKSLRGAKYVINSAAAEIGETWPATETAVRTVMTQLADACLAAGIERLVHLGSTAALYLGAPGVRITGASPVDPQPDGRALYSRAKAFGDLVLLAAHTERKLPLCVLRPAIVVGQGGTPYHTGVGLFANGRHCIGWNAGNNALPFVLASDIAAAAIAACRRPGIEGKSYNLAGDVRMSASDYVRELAAALHRPFTYHPQSTSWLWLTEVGKWSIKRAAGRAAWLPSLRDLSSRAFLSDLDCTDAKRDLGWSPVADRARFIAEGIAVHAGTPDASW